MRARHTEFNYLILIVVFLVITACNNLLRPVKASNNSDIISLQESQLDSNLIDEKSFLIMLQQERVFFHSEPRTIFIHFSGDGDGSSVNNAVKLEDALLSANIIPGDTLVLIDGIYKGTFQVNLRGTPDLPVTIKALNDWQAVIDGGLIIGDLNGEKGSHVVIRNLEITCSDPWRGTWETPQGSISRPPGVNVQAPFVSVINNLIHDGGIGVCGYSLARECIVYGNVIWNSGWADNVLGGAQNIYMHSARKTIRHNVFSGAFKRTVQLHGNRGALTESTVSENVAICKESFLVGSYNVPNHDIVIDGNHILGWAEIGYVYDPNENVTVCRNIIYTNDYSGIRLQHWRNVHMNSNKIIKPSHLSVDVFIPSDDAQFLKSYTIDSNQYFQSPEGYKQPFEIRKHKTVSFPEWQKMGYDVNGTFTYHLPENNEVYLYPNEFPGDKRMGMVVIWNWEGLDQVAVNLEELALQEGQSYMWRNAQDPIDDTATWLHSGNPYLFPMTDRTVAYPIGFSELLVPNQFPLFGCFIIEGL